MLESLSNTFTHVTPPSFQLKQNKTNVLIVVNIMLICSKTIIINPHSNNKLPIMKDFWPKLYCVFTLSKLSPLVQDTKHFLT